MSLTEPTLADPITPSDAWKQAADRVTPFSQYLGEKLLGGLEATPPAQILNQALMPAPADYPTDEMRVFGPSGTFDVGSPALTKEQYEASPHSRPGVPWDAGMTEARAEALATQHDRVAWNKSLIERSDAGWMGETAGFVAGLAPGIVDPVNYIPLLGPSVKAAMVARLGVIGGSVALHGAEAAANTALFEPLTAATAFQQGQPYGWEDAAADIALGALAGSVGGAIHGGLEYRGSLRQAATRAGVPAVMRSADGLNLALEQLDRGRTVDVAPVVAGEPALQRLRPEPETFDVGGIVPRRAGEAPVDRTGLISPQDDKAPLAPASPEAAGAKPEAPRYPLPSPEELARRKAIVDALVRDGIMTREELALPEPAAHRVYEPEPVREPVPELPDEQARQLLAEEQTLVGGRDRGGRMSEGTKARLDEIMRLLPSDSDQRTRLQTEQMGRVASDRVSHRLGVDRGRARGGRAVPGDAGGGAPSRATAAPVEPHPSVAEGAKRAGKAGDPLETFKQDAQLEGYEKPLPGHEPVKPEAAGSDVDAILGNMHRRLYAAYRAGETTEAGKPSVDLGLAKSVQDRGRTLSADEFKAFVGEVSKARILQGPEHEAALREIADRWAASKPDAAALAKANAALPPELQDVEHMRQTGDLPEGAEARLATAETEAQAHEADATAMETLAACVMREALPAAASAGADHLAGLNYAKPRAQRPGNYFAYRTRRNTRGA